MFTGNSYWCVSFLSGVYFYLKLGFIEGRECYRFIYLGPVSDTVGGTITFYHHIIAQVYQDDVSVFHLGAKKIIDHF